MRDVAALAGVSLKTVSRVVNGEPGVSPALADKVTRAARQLDYRPNLTASTLRRSDGRSSIIGLLIEDVANPFSASVYRAIEDVADTRGVAVLAASIEEDPERERVLATSLFNRRIDGLIIASASDDHSYLANEQKAGTAIVFVDRPPRLIAADSVTSDNRGGTHTGVQQLIAAGHRRIAFLGDTEQIATATDRLRGYTDALADAGIALDPSLVHMGIRAIDKAQWTVGELLALPDPPTALFTAQNLITIGAFRALRTALRHHDVALIGFDDFLLADLLDPPVTVVAQDLTSIGTTAAKMLFSRIDGDQSPVASVVVPCTLVRRGSGEILPA